MSISVYDLAKKYGFNPDQVILTAKKHKITHLKTSQSELSDEEAKVVARAITKGSSLVLKKKDSAQAPEKTDLPKVAKAKTSSQKDEEAALPAKKAAAKKPSNKATLAQEVGEASPEIEPPKKKRTKKTDEAADTPTAQSAEIKGEEKTTEEQEEVQPAKKTTKKAKATVEKKVAAPPTLEPHPLEISEPTLVESPIGIIETTKAAEADKLAGIAQEKHPDIPTKSSMVRVEFGEAGAKYQQTTQQALDKLEKVASSTENKAKLKAGEALLESQPKPVGFQFLYKTERKVLKEGEVEAPKRVIKHDKVDIPGPEKRWRGGRSGGSFDEVEGEAYEAPHRYTGLKAFKRSKHKAAQIAMPQRKKELVIEENISIMELSELTGIKASDLIKALMKIDIMVTINQTIPAETAQLICSELGVELRVEKEDLEKLLEEADLPEDHVLRAPVVTIMGHVDHGKTSLLDYIRKTKVADKEAGGITQHIGAYRVEMPTGGITFLDTPGHEAFTAMRARGANATDIVVLVVAADDGPKPQTIEAINHAKAANATIIVAINKCDKPDARPDRTIQMLMEHGLQADSFGGDISMVQVSAKTGQGVDELLNIINLQAEVMELKGNPKVRAQGIIIEARVDRVRGSVSSLLVQNGTLRVGDIVLTGSNYAKVRAMFNERSQKVEAVLPSYPIEILGFEELPKVGDRFQVVESEKLARQIAENRQGQEQSLRDKAASPVRFEELFLAANQEQKKINLNLILKADVQGSLEAIAEALKRWNNDKIDLKIIHQSVGAINGSDVGLAAASKAIVVGFNVRPDANAKQQSEADKVEIKLYSVIYNLLDDIKHALEGLFDVIVTEEMVGKADVLSLFPIPKIGVVAGCKVTDGKVLRTSLVRVLRDNIVIHKGKLSSLKRFKDDAKEVFSGFECGLVIENYKNLKVGDALEFFDEKRENVVLENSP